jgi:hypothetical protein
MINNTRKCKLAPKKSLCHIHNKYNQNEPRQNDLIKIIDLEIKNEQLEKKIYKMSKFQDNQRLVSERQSSALCAAKIELTNLYKTIEKKNIGLREKEHEISKLKYKINNMTEDYNNFQIIKQYEKTKQELLKKNIDILSFKNSQFHKLRLDRNYIVHEKTLISP